MDSGVPPRIEHLDVAKGIAIIAVIIGHCGISSINAIVYSFHLPLFYIISGYFSRSDNTFSQFIKKRFKQLIIPYIITAGIIVAIHTLESYISVGYWPTRTALKCISLAALYGSGSSVSLPCGNVPSIGAIWFLPAMFFAQIIWRYTATKKKPILWLISIFIIGYLTSSIVWLPLSIQAGMTCSLFIYIGNQARKINILIWLSCRKTILLYLIGLCIWVIT